MIEEQILSKILDEQNIYEVLKFNITAEDFPTQSDVFNYITDYHNSHNGIPDYRTIAAEFPNFDYQANITEPFKGLASRVKQQTAKRKAFELLQNDTPGKFQSLTGDKFVKWLKCEVEKIEQVSSSDYSLGVNFATNGAERKADYFERKERRSFQYIPYPYPSLNKYLGGAELGDYILLMAFTNRGKSWIGSHMAQHAWRNDFSVLHYSPELSKQQQQTRLETLDGHFNNVNLKRGELENENQYVDYLEQFAAGKGNANYILKTMEDLPNGLTTDVIEADLQVFPHVKMVIIDGFNLMVHKGRGSNRDSMSTTSRNLRQIFGRHGVAGLVIHQTPGSAEKENKEEEEDGTRIVKPPTVDQYSETIAVIQDASTVLTFDAHDGVGKIAIRKAREPHVNEVVDLQCNFNLGYITEPDAADMF